MSSHRPGQPTWSALVVDDGQPARAEGMLIRLHGEPRLVADGGTITTANGVDVVATHTVPLRCAAPEADLRAHEETQVVATGTLRDGHLIIDTADDLTRRERAGPDAAVRLAAGTTFAGEGHHRRLPRRPGAESALMDEGTLLDAWTDDRTGRRIALATDPERVRAVLTPHHGDALDVAESRWSRGLLDRIGATVDEELLCSLGAEIGPDRQLRVAVTLLHLPARLTHHLRRFPAAALTVRVLIGPHPAGLSGDAPHWRSGADARRSGPR